MSRDAARRKAERARAELGWPEPTGEAPRAARSRAALRLVQTESG